jgi:hypothetical protein
LSPAEDAQAAAGQPVSDTEEDAEQAEEDNAEEDNSHKTSADYLATLDQVSAELVNLQQLLGARVGHAIGKEAAEAAVQAAHPKVCALFLIYL